MRVFPSYALPQALILIPGFVDELIENAHVIVAVFIGKIADEGLEHHGDNVENRIAPDGGVDSHFYGAHKGCEGSIEHQPQHGKQIGPGAGAQGQHAHKQHAHQSGNLRQKSGFQTALGIVFDVAIFYHIVIPHGKLVDIRVVKIDPQNQ